MAITEPLVPLDDETLRRLFWTVSGFEEGGSWTHNEYERFLEQRASWDAASAQKLDELKSDRLQKQRDYDDALFMLRRHTDDPGVRVYLANELKSDDHLKRLKAVGLLGKLKRRDWVVAALTAVARKDPYKARRSTSSVYLSDPDVAEQHMETYFELREVASRALFDLR
jgi:hypothetical protein